MKRDNSSEVHENIENAENEESEDWKTLSALVHEAEKLNEKEKRALKGIIRRNLAHEQAEETAALNIVRIEDVDSLAQIIHSLPVHTEEEIFAFVEELELTGEEAEMEIANWAYRHQSVSGDLLVTDQVISFRLIRLNEYSYILLSLGDIPEIEENFSEVFGQSPRVHSNNSLRDQNQAWASWAWLMDPNPDTVQRDAEKLRQLWEGMS